MGKIRNFIVSAVSGLLFAAGWWIFIDASAYRDHAPGYNAGPFVYYIAGILATIGLFLLNNLDKRLFTSDGWADEVAVWEKILIVVSVMFHLASLIAAIWIYAVRKGDHNVWETNWQGISQIVQTILIIASSLVWRFLWKDDEY